MKITELEGVSLDYWVARADERRVALRGSVCYVGINALSKTDGYVPNYSPSTDWAQGGPIIEREQIELLPGDEWEAFIKALPDAHWDATLGIHSGTARYWKGSTPLIAAMRAYVASKFGEEVEDALSGD